MTSDKPLFQAKRTVFLFTNVPASPWKDFIKKNEGALLTIADEDDPWNEDDVMWHNGVRSYSYNVDWKKMQLYVIVDDRKPLNKKQKRIYEQGVRVGGLQIRPSWLEKKQGPGDPTENETTPPSPTFEVDDKVVYPDDLVFALSTTEPRICTSAAARKCNQNLDRCAKCGVWVCTNCAEVCHNHGGEAAKKERKQRPGLCECGDQCSICPTGNSAEWKRKKDATKTMKSKKCVLCETGFWTELNNDHACRYHPKFYFPYDIDKDGKYSKGWTCCYTDRGCTSTRHRVEGEADKEYPPQSMAYTWKLR